MPFDPYFTSKWKPAKKETPTWVVERRRHREFKAFLKAGQLSGRLRPDQWITKEEWERGFPHSLGL